MAAIKDAEALLRAKFAALFPHLDERQRRLMVAAEARSLGHGGIRVVARAAGMREGTVSQGVAELESGAEPLGRVRREGGGRKRLADLDPGLVPALLTLVEPDERGDPMSPLRWTTKSLRTLARELTATGHKVGADTVAELLREQGFSLQANAKTIEGKQHPDRDAQFRHINEQVKQYQAAGDPVRGCDWSPRAGHGRMPSGWSCGPCSVDATVARAHAAGACRYPAAQAEAPIGESADLVLGRSRGERSTKLHLPANRAAG